MSDAKTCSRCREALPLTAFSPDRRAPDGKQRWCKTCCNTRRRELYAANPERFNERQRRYRANDPAAAARYSATTRARNAEKIKAGKKAYYERIKLSPEWQAKEKAKREANRARKAEYDRARIAAMDHEARARLLEKVKAWKLANPENRRVILLAYDARRRTAKKGGDSPKVVREWMAAQPKVCFWCSTDCAESFHVDHFYPLAKGGEHRVDNLVIACRPCNNRKSARDPYEFAAMIGKELAA